MPIRFTVTSALRVAAVILGLTSASEVWAQRLVIVNGTVLSPQQLAVLDQLAGGPVPNGNYWLNPMTGVWGYAGNPMPQGQIGGGSPANAWGAGGPGYNRRTPGGDLMSDGNCSFIAGVPVGNCQ